MKVTVIGSHLCPDTPIIATLGFIFDPAATCLNSSGDTIASMMVTRIVEGKDWLVKAMAAKKTEQA